MIRYLKPYVPPFIKKIYSRFSTRGTPVSLTTTSQSITQPEFINNTQSQMSNNLESIACPYCDSRNASTFSNIADIVKCSSCQLVYLRTRPTKEALYQIYQVYANDTSHMRPPNTVDEAKTHGLRREQLGDEIVSMVTQKSGNWLDIGCGWGAFLLRARELGFTPVGIEMTRICLDFASMQLQIPVSNSQFTDSSIPVNSCQVISMVHVLEHIPNPKETLTKIYDTLVPGGSFCGIVPNIASYCSEIEKDQWVWLDPTHHYVHYSPETLRQKLEEAGFVIDKIYTSVGDYNEFFDKIIRRQYPSLNDAELYRKTIEIEQSGKGEEIRFFVKKPF